MRVEIINSGVTLLKSMLVAIHLLVLGITRGLIALSKMGPHLEDVSEAINSEEN